MHYHGENPDSPNGTDGAGRSKTLGTLTLEAIAMTNVWSTNIVPNTAQRKLAEYDDGKLVGIGGNTIRFPLNTTLNSPLVHSGDFTGISINILRIRVTFYQQFPSQYDIFIISGIFKFNC